MSGKTQSQDVMTSLDEELDATHQDVLERVSSSQYRAAFLEHVHVIQARSKRRRQRGIVAILGLCCVGLGSGYLMWRDASPVSEGTHTLMISSDRQVTEHSGFGAPLRAAGTRDSTSPSVIRVGESQAPFYLFESQKTDYSSLELARDEVRTFWLKPGEHVSTDARSDECVVFQHERRAVMLASKPGDFTLMMHDVEGTLRRTIDVRVMHEVRATPEELKMSLHKGEEYVFDASTVLNVFPVSAAHVDLAQNKEGWRVRGVSEGTAFLLVLKPHGDAVKLWVNVVPHSK